MPRKPSFMKFTPDEEQELKNSINKLEAQGNIRASIRGRAILASHLGMTVKQIAGKYGFNERSIWYWRAAFEKHGIEGLKGKYHSSKL